MRAASDRLSGFASSSNDDEYELQFDYRFEVCMYAGTCVPGSHQCITAYNLALTTNENPTKDAYQTTTGQQPLQGSGDVALLHYYPVDGPWLPCPVGPDGRQLPCSDDNSTSSDVQPDDLVLHLRDLSLTVLKLDNDAFDVLIKYKAAWADRSAVHPCTIGLYKYGEGVPSSGKRVRADNWWKPEAFSSSATSYETLHPPTLGVSHSPGEFVTKPCTVDTCPWPKQLYLEDDVKVHLKFAAAWDLAKFPFDSQTLAGSFLVANNFASETTRIRTRITVDRDREMLSKALSSVYSPTDWKTTSARIFASGGLEIEFEAVLQRNAKSAIFKVLIPIIVNALLIIAVSGQGTGSGVVLAVGISVVAGSLMLNPVNLGLPANVQGVPFVQCLVIIHLGVSAMFILYVARQVVKEHHWNRHMVTPRAELNESHKNAWKKASKTYKELIEQVLPPLDSDEPPSSYGEAALASGTSSTVHVVEVAVEIEGKKGPSPEDTQRAFLKSEMREKDSASGAVANEPSSTWLAKVLSLLPIIMTQKGVVDSPHEYGEENPKYWAFKEKQRKLELLMPLITFIVYAVCWIIAVLIYFA